MFLHIPSAKWFSNPGDSLDGLSVCEAGNIQAEFETEMYSQCKVAGLCGISDVVQVGLRLVCPRWCKIGACQTRLYILISSR